MESKLFAFSCIVLLILTDTPVQARKLEDKIVFVSERRGTPEVFLVEGLDGRPVQLTRNLFASWPSISPDGTEVAFVAKPPGQNIFKLNIAKRQIEQLTNNAERHIRYEHLDWSPDGRKILFIMITDAPEDLRIDLCVMDIKRRHIRHILQPDSPMWIVHPKWSPDSEHIIYYYQGNREAGISIISNDGNNIVNITSHPFTPADLPTWSPKRSQIGYIDNTIITQPPPPNPLQIYMINLAKV